MLATILTAVVEGLEGAIVRVEVDVAPGLPACHIVGLPDTALSEARERVRGAIRNSGLEYPSRRITVNLAPAGRRKYGAAYDVAIAVGIVVASGEVRPLRQPCAFLGELSLGGAIQPVAGVLPMVATLARAGVRRVGVPLANVGEAGVVDGIEVVPLTRLEDAVVAAAGRLPQRSKRSRVDPVATRDRTHAGEPPEAPPAVPRGLVGEDAAVDLADVRGQLAARWALEVALVGGHSLLLVGPPGSGKTMLARSIAGLLPPLADEEALEVTVVRSVAGLQAAGEGLCRRRPFRAPHHTSSYVALVGGGTPISPGEVTLAHRGTLFLDELTEFDRNVLESLRQPLEEGSVVIARAQGALRFPARVQLVAAMNPCPCGYFGDLERPCRCSPGEPERYVRRVSGPLLDRLDLRVEMGRVPSSDLLQGGPVESSAAVASRVAAARRRSEIRNGGRLNADLSGRAAEDACRLDRRSRSRLAEIADARGLSARGVHRILRIARSIADLDGDGSVRESAVLAAADLRDPAVLSDPALAA